MNAMYSRLNAVRRIVRELRSHVTEVLGRAAEESALERRLLFTAEVRDDGLRLYIVNPFDATKRNAEAQLIHQLRLRNSRRFFGVLVELTDTRLAKRKDNSTAFNGGDARIHASSRVRGTSICEGHPDARIEVDEDSTMHVAIIDLERIEQSFAHFVGQ